MVTLHENKIIKPDGKFLRQNRFTVLCFLRLPITFHAMCTMLTTTYFTVERSWSIFLSNTSFIRFARVKPTTVVAQKALQKSRVGSHGQWSLQIVY